MTNLELITFNVILRHPGGRRQTVRTTAYDMAHAEYKVINSFPLATVVCSTIGEHNPVIEHSSPVVEG
jgi:hypothetical protein